MPSHFHIATLLCLLACACTSRTPVPLTHEVYVWQHVWGPDTANAVVHRPIGLAAIHVLAGEFRLPHRKFWPTDVDLEVLAHAGPVVATVRIDGTAILDELSWHLAVEQVQHWQAAGLSIVAVEVDYDCPTARLPDYAT